MRAEEQELKLGLSPAGLGRLARDLRRKGAVVPAGMRLRTIYLDSADHCLAAAGIAWRLRRTPQGWVQSLKSGRTALGGFQHSRENEAPIAGARPDPAAIADPLLRQQVRDVLAGRPLRPWFETQVRRRTVRVAAPGGLVDVALDQGEIVAGRAREPLCEAEFELVAGSPEALFDLAAGLTAGLPVRLALPNKAARGAALAAGVPLRPAPCPSRPPRAAPGAPAAEQVDRLLAAIVPAIAGNLDLVLADDSPEGPHQLRIALRRLRAMLRLYRPVIAEELANTLAATARDLGRVLAPLRDADVLAGDLLIPQADPALADALADWRVGCRAETRARLVDFGAGAFVIQLLKLAALGGWQRAGHRARLTGPHAQVAAPAIERLWKGVRRRGRALAMLSGEERHELRKGIKKLRYALEQVEESEATARFVQALKRLQEDLGALNDLDVLDGFRPNLGDPVLMAALDELKQQLPGGSTARFDQLMGRACRHFRALAALPLPLPAPARELA